MALEHDYDKFPELTNKQLEVEQFNSPHVQITQDFHGTVTKVHDGDTITLLTSFRDFTFPLRILDIDAPELSEGGEGTRDWLQGRIEGEEVMITIDKRNRVGKYGRLLGHVIHRGIDVAEEMMWLGLVAPFGKKAEGRPEPLTKIFSLEKWF